MKSFRVWKRLASDYGFEGAFRGENVLKFRNAVILMVGAGLTTASALSFTIRMYPGNPLPNSSVNASTRTVTTERFGSIRAVLLAKLRDVGLTWDDLVHASTRLAPIESQMLEVGEISQLISSLKHQYTKEDMQTILITVKAGSVVRNLFTSVVEDGTSPNDVTDHVLKRLLDDWIARGYFNSSTYPNRDAFGSRQTSEAIGVDIGSTVTSALSDDHSLNELNSAAIRSGLSSLQQFGFVYIREAVSSDVLSHLKESLNITGRPSGEVGAVLLSKDANISHSRASPNRLQLVLRGSKLEELTASIHTAVLPLITSHYDRRGIQSRLILTDVRLVVVDHAAHELSWTTYNQRGGFSVMIPLQTHDCRSGSQEFIPGSHMLLETNINLIRRIFMFLERYIGFKRPLTITELSADGTWQAGDAFVFDNRLLIRGTGNDLFRSGSYILAKYETADEAPSPFFLRRNVLLRLAQFFSALAYIS